MDFFFSSSYSRDDYLKVIILGFCFFFIIGSYTLLRELKDAIFTIIVGYKYLPDAKALSLMCMIPMVMFYGWLSGRMRKYYLLSFYAIFYAIITLIIAYYINHPTIGLANNISAYNRIFGWICYLLLEGLSPFLVSLNWSFLNWVSSPEDTKSFYIIMAGMGKFGALVFSLFTWLIIVYKFSFFHFSSEVALYTFLLKLTSFSLFFIPLLLLSLVMLIPKDKLRGYAEKHESIAGSNKKTDSFGLKKIFENSYVLSIIGTILFWEIINVSFNNLRLMFAFSSSSSISDFSAFLFKSTAITSLISFLFIIIGTNSIIRICGVRVAILLIPILTGSMMAVFLMYSGEGVIIFVWTMLRVINLSLAIPIRESLYIPTSQEIQFKTKSWIDSFGQKFAKGCGSLYVKVLQFLPFSIVYSFQVGFFIVIIGLWTLIAYFLGNRWKKAVQEDKVIS